MMMGDPLFETNAILHSSNNKDVVSHLGRLYSISASKVFRFLRETKDIKLNCIVIDTRDLMSYQYGHLAASCFVDTFNFNCSSKIMARQAIAVWTSYFNQSEIYSQAFLSNSILIYDQSTDCINSSSSIETAPGLGLFISSLLSNGCKVIFMQGGYSLFILHGKNEELINDFIRTIPRPEEKRVDLNRNFNRHIVLHLRQVLGARSDTRNQFPHQSAHMKTIQQEDIEEISSLIIPINSCCMGLKQSKFFYDEDEEDLKPVAIQDSPSRVQRSARTNLNPLRFLTSDNQNPMVFSKQSSGTDIWNANISRILDYLYLGNSKDAQDADLLQSLSITHIINVTDNEPMLTFGDKFKCLRLSATDNVEQDLIPVFKQANEFISKTREEKGIVLVHCQAGVSRSVSVVIAYLMKINPEFTVTEALNFVQSRRSIAGPNLHFMGQLTAYWEALHSGQQHDHPSEQLLVKAKSLESFEQKNIAASQALSEHSEWSPSSTESNFSSNYTDLLSP